MLTTAKPDDSSWGGYPKNTPMYENGKWEPMGDIKDADKLRDEFTQRINHYFGKKDGPPITYDMEQFNSDQKKRKEEAAKRAQKVNNIFGVSDMTKNVHKNFNKLIDYWGGQFEKAAPTAEDKTTAKAKADTIIEERRKMNLLRDDLLTIYEIISLGETHDNYKQGGKESGVFRKAIERALSEPYDEKLFDTLNKLFHEWKWNIPTQLNEEAISVPVKIVISKDEFDKHHYRGLRTLQTLRDLYQNKQNPTESTKSLEWLDYIAKQQADFLLYSNTICKLSGLGGTDLTVKLNSYGITLHDFNLKFQMYCLGRTPINIATPDTPTVTYQDTSGRYRHGDSSDQKRVNDEYNIIDDIYERLAKLQPAIDNTNGRHHYAYAQIREADKSDKPLYVLRHDFWERIRELRHIFITDRTKMDNSMRNRCILQENSKFYIPAKSPQKYTRTQQPALEALTQDQRQSLDCDIWRLLSQEDVSHNSLNNKNSNLLYKPADTWQHFKVATKRHCTKQGSPDAWPDDDWLTYDYSEYTCRDVLPSIYNQYGKNMKPTDEWVKGLKGGGTGGGTVNTFHVGSTKEDSTSKPKEKGKFDLIKELDDIDMPDNVNFINNYFDEINKVRDTIQKEPENELEKVKNIYTTVVINILNNLRF